MGGPGSGVNRGSPNGAVLAAIDQARWRLIEAEDNAQKCSKRLGWTYYHLKLAEKEVTAAIEDLTRLQQSLGDENLTDRETGREEEMTVSHPTRLSQLHAALVETAKANGQKPAMKKAATA